MSTLDMSKYRFASNLAFSAFLPSRPTTIPFFLGSTITIACKLPSSLLFNLTSETNLEFRMFFKNFVASSEYSTISTFQSGGTSHDLSQ